MFNLSHLFIGVAALAFRECNSNDTNPVMISNAVIATVIVSPLLTRT